MNIVQLVKIDINCQTGMKTQSLVGARPQFSQKFLNVFRAAKISQDRSRKIPLVGWL